ncbi:MerR family transcriptional regulator [Streptomyces sp. NPDC021562]|uniref:MerR family transcriptional regulator n=1 Tax=Streptomyces sp. NPDC021562 TaxID=3155121 RepID=UPI00340F1C17
MRLAELSRRSAVSIATIKYYLRSGLLPPGERITATEADYNEGHLHQLRLIRALIGIGQLPVSATKEILDAVSADQNDPGPTLAKTLNAAFTTRGGQQAADTAASTQPQTRGITDARNLVAQMGWCVPHSAPAVGDLGEILDALSAVGADIDWQTMLPYAQIVDEISRLDSQQIHNAADALRAERTAVVTVLLEPALRALRRLALEDKLALRNAEEARTR